MVVLILQRQEAGREVREVGGANDISAVSGAHRGHTAAPLCRELPTPWPLPWLTMGFLMGTRASAGGAPAGLSRGARGERTVSDIRL